MIEHKMPLWWKVWATAVVVFLLVALAVSVFVAWHFLAKVW